MGSIKNPRNKQERLQSIKIVKIPETAKIKKIENYFSKRRARKDDSFKDISDRILISEVLL